MKFYPTLASVMSLLLLNSPLVAQIENIPPDTNAIPPQPPPPEVVPTPAQVVQKRAQEFLNENYHRFNLTATFNKGVLTVKGLVPSELYKHEVGTRLSDIDGVQSVDNQIIVGPPIPGYERESGAEFVPQQ